jgi:methanogenic corrinoid protein MtbC1
MDERGLLVASLLDACAQEVAASTAARRCELYPAAASAGFAALRDEAEVRLAYLAESAAVGTVELFSAHVAWLRDAGAARGVAPDDLHAGLSCLRDELEPRLEAGLGGAVLAQLDAGLEVLRGPPTEIESVLIEGLPHLDLAHGFLFALLEGRRDDALVLIETALAGGVSVSLLETEVIARVQVEIGRLWQRGEIRVAEEHLGTSIVEDVLAVLGRHIPTPQAPHRRVVLSALAGNSHDIGLHIVRDHLNLGGLETVFLGSSMPAEDVVWAVGEFDARLVALSTALPTEVRTTAATIAAIRAAHPDVGILVGGGVYVDVPELWRVLGADDCAHDAREAVHAAGRLLTAPGQPR